MIFKYNLYEHGDKGSNLTVLWQGELLTAADTHPNWTAILAGVRAGDENVVNLFDVAKAVAERFERVSDRVTLRGGKFYLDGDEVNNALTKKVLQFVDAGLDDYKPLINFFEKVQSNPDERSREMLFTWLEAHDFPIDDDGNIVAYKGVRDYGDGTFAPHHQGHGFVNGVEIVNGLIVQKPGDIVEIPRSEVNADPVHGCHVGLHIGNFRFASGFSEVTLLVKVNPRDVVSVPSSSAFEKCRVCRYEIVGVVEEENTSVVYRSEVWEDDDDSWGDDSWDYDDEYWDDTQADWKAQLVAEPVRPTADNYKKQQRDAQGRFIPKHRKS